MGFKKFIFLLIFILIMPVSYEMIQRFQRGAPPSEPNYSQFEYEYYVEIYDKFFKENRLPDGNIIYETKRAKAVSHKFQAYKPSDMKRIFIIGGSVARGAFSDAAKFKNMLGDFIPGIKFEVILCGMGGYDSYRESLIEKEILGYNPDLIILMSGNNEYFVPVRLNLWFYRLNRLFRRAWFYRNLQREIAVLRRKPQISGVSRLTDFENNIRIMARRAKKSGIPIALCTLPVNFRDCPPQGVPPWQDKQFFLGWAALKEDRHLEAAKNFLNKFLMIRPGDKFGHYFLAQCYEGLGNYPKAKMHYLKSLDLDTDPGDRCTPQRNEIIRRICIQEGAILVDLDRAFTEISTNGLVGDNLFVDHCHWWGRYHPLIYRKIIKAMISYNNTHSNPLFVSLDRWQGNKQILEDFKFGDIEERCMEERGFNKILYSLKSIQDSKLSFGSLYSPREPVSPNFISERAIASIEAAYRFDHEVFLREESLLKMQIFERASLKWPGLDIPVNFDDYWSIFLYHTGETFRRLKLYSLAMEYLDEAIGRDTKYWFPYLSRGLTEHALGFIEKAEKDLEEADKKSGHGTLVKFYKEYLGV